MNQAVIALMDDEIQEQIQRIASLKSGSEEYDRGLKDLDAQLSLKAKHSPKGRVEQIVNNGPLLSLLGDIMKVGLILNHERASILVSKASSFIRPRN